MLPSHRYGPFSHGRQAIPLNSSQANSKGLYSVQRQTRPARQGAQRAVAQEHGKILPRSHEPHRVPLVFYAHKLSSFWEPSRWYRLQKGLRTNQRTIDVWSIREPLHRSMAVNSTLIHIGPCRLPLQTACAPTMRRSSRGIEPTT